MVSNNIIIVFCSPFMFHIIAIFTQGHMYKASFLALAIGTHSVFGPANGPIRAEGLNVYSTYLLYSINLFLTSNIDVYN